MADKLILLSCADHFGGLGCGWPSPTGRYRTCLNKLPRGSWHFSKWSLTKAASRETASSNELFSWPRKNFLTLFQNPNLGLDYYCIACENFKADPAMEELKRQGLNPNRPSGTDRVCFPDSDGLTVQLSSVRLESPILVLATLGTEDCR